MSPKTQRLLIVIEEGSPAERVELSRVIQATVRRMATRRNLKISVTEVSSPRTARGRRLAARLPDGDA